ncbi:ClpP/crotonase [Calocera cornea HHB12733]|uniref:ClpP/crotonase n=1 Tax=Calocera cornea HHB12733 TaxID=1353952 RepID=A0A165HDQ5_9BASI|nr:ClpP/crotonase [Calocera cornea HHB12733]
MSHSSSSGSSSKAFPLGAVLHTLELSHPKPDLWIIELLHGVENRLSRLFMSNAILPALQAIEEEWLENRGNGAVIITGNQSQDKFFCNGLVLEELQHDKQLTSVLDQLCRRLFTYPLPIICAMNGHTFAAGLVFALACDYRVMTSGKAWCCMNEVLFGVPLPATVAAILRAKLADASTLRKCSLEGHRFTAQECLACGMVDELADGGSSAVLQAATKIAVKVNMGAKAGVWGLIKEEIYRDVIDTIDEGRLVNLSPAKL